MYIPVIVRLSIRDPGVWRHGEKNSDMKTRLSSRWLVLVLLLSNSLCQEQGAPGKIKSSGHGKRRNAKLKRSQENATTDSAPAAAGERLMSLADEEVESVVRETAMEAARVQAEADTEAARVKATAEAKAAEEETARVEPKQEAAAAKAAAKAAGPVLNAATSGPTLKVNDGQPAHTVQALFVLAFDTPTADAGGTYGDWEAGAQNPPPNIHTPSNPGFRVEGSKDFKAPHQIASRFFPKRGVYSSSDAAVLADQMAMMKNAGVDVVVLSLPGRPGGPKDVDVRRRESMDAAFDAAEHAGLVSPAVHLTMFG